jgi:phytoene dehydrogenase-like protein
VHDICSAIHPLVLASPFFQSLPLDVHGLKWIQPPIPMAHPFAEGSAAILDRSISLTSESLIQDANAYKKLMGPLVKNWEPLNHDILGPLRFPQHPILMARFAVLAIRSCQGLSQAFFKEKQARGFFAGLCAHSIMALDRPLY